MEASSKLKALKFMKRGSPAAAVPEPSPQEQKLSEQREKLAGESRWRLSAPPKPATSKLAVVSDYSPSAAVQASAESRRLFNKACEDGDEDVDMEEGATVAKNSQRRSMEKSAEKKHKDKVSQKSKQKFSSSLKK